MIDTAEIIDIIKTNNSKNIICRALELRPKELGSYVSCLANMDGGYLLIGVEMQNDQFTIIGLQTSFNFNSVMQVVASKLDPDVNFCYDIIKVNNMNILVVNVEKANMPISYEGKFYMLKNNYVQEVEKEKMTYIPTLFISYATSDTPIVDIVESTIKNLLENKISISRFTELSYKASFKAFMNSIQDHDYVLCFVSDSYLKSRACMYEVGEVIKDHHYSSRLLFIVLSEKDRCYYDGKAPDIIEAGIYDYQKHADYSLYWKNQYEELDSKIKKIGDYEATRDLARILNEIGNIYRNDISEFMTFVADENGKSFSELLKNEFSDIINILKKQ